MPSQEILNVQIAASNISLDELHSNLDATANEAPITAVSDSRGDKPSRRELNLGSEDDMVVVSVPSINPTTEQSSGESRIGKPESRLQRLPQQVAEVPFVEQLKQRLVSEKSTGKSRSKSPAKKQAPSASETQPKPQPTETPKTVVESDAIPAIESCIPAQPTKTPNLSKPSIADAPLADISERPDDWLPDHDNVEKRTSKKAKPLDTPKQAFTDLTDRVLEQFPLGASSVLLIADVDGNSSGDLVAHQLALQISQKNVGRVLLVDSHFEKRQLSDRLSLGFEIGLADLLSTNKTLSEALCESESPNLDVLPVGTDRMCKRRNPESTWLADNISPLKDEYQFIIVSAGNVFHRSTEMWCKHCDASYMAIGVETTNQTIAKSGVVRLQQYGARLLGCVVTDRAA